MNGAERVSPPLPRLMRVEEAARALGVSQEHLRRWCRTKRINFFRLGQRYRFTDEHLVAFLRLNSRPKRV